MIRVETALTNNRRIVKKFTIVPKEHQDIDNKDPDVHFFTSVQIPSDFFTKYFLYAVDSGILIKVKS